VKGISFPGREHNEREADDSPPSTTEVVNAGIYTSIPAYSFTAWRRTHVLCGNSQEVLLQTHVATQTKVSFYLPEHCSLSEDIQQLCWQSLLMTC